MYCAIPPVDMSAARVGRGNGNGWNRQRTVRDQYHAGLDFVAGTGSPIVASVPGRVVLIGSDASRPGRDGLNGYGNCVVIEHRFQLPTPTSPLPGASRPPAQGMPPVFWTLYAHMQGAPLVRVGQQVTVGTPLGYVGNTTNGQFSGMGAHLHFEVRKAPYPSSYDNDTIDPALLFASLGIDHVGSHQDAERRTGGLLQVRAGGPSDCRAGARTELAGYLATVYGPSTSGQAGPGEQYISPAVLAPNYPGVTRAGGDVEPPEYASKGKGSGSGVGLLLGVLGIAGLALWAGSR